MEGRALSRPKIMGRHSGHPSSRTLNSGLFDWAGTTKLCADGDFRGVDNGTGIGVVEAYDLDRAIDSKLANISTRGLVQTGDNALFAGTIVLGETSQKVIIRAIGPSLNIAGKMDDPILELRNANGDLIRENDNWQTGGQKDEIEQTMIPPPHDLESAIVETLSGNGASYTAIVRGVGNTTGIAVVEMYALN